MPPAFQPGFRISVVDGVAVAVGVIAAIAFAPSNPLLSAFIGFTVGHFFLFCNVFRIRRSYELIWAGTFITLSALRIFIGVPGWPWVFAGALTIAAVFIFLSTREEDYHGVCWRRFNPMLEDWWRKRHASPEGQSES